MKTLTLTKNRKVRFAKSMRAKGFSEAEIKAKLWPKPHTKVEL